MPQPGERYNRFLKYLMPSVHEGKINETQDWTSTCQICKKSRWRNNELIFSAGVLMCRDGCGPEGIWQ